jgi:hypothetical protein
MFGGEVYTPSGALFTNEIWSYDLGSGQWTWEHGTTVAQVSVFGTLGVPSDSTMPGGRSHPGSYYDSTSKRLYLFGGQGYDETNNAGHNRLNDMWSYDMSTGQWTWLGGSKAYAQAGNYGTMGIASASNWPGGRQGSKMWHSGGKLHLFGGNGYDRSGTIGRENDLVSGLVRRRFIQIHAISDFPVSVPSSGALT